MSGLPGIRIDVPGHGAIVITHIVTDYTGTLSLSGILREGVKERLVELSRFVEVHVLTSDTFGRAAQQLAEINLTLKILADAEHDRQKEEYVRSIGSRSVAAFGNGQNDRCMLKEVKSAGGLAVAVDTGEGCAVEAIFNASIFIHEAVNALDLLLQPNRCKATLRF